jgi:TPP-dependent indolepyruvate ferredoxin oxidoreductase alpha subunit
MKEPKVTVSLDDRWSAQSGRVVLSGAQVIGWILLAQKDRDRRNGLNTAGYITGYRGSPLGNIDNALWSMGSRLAETDIVFQPGLNEDIAATAVRGTQQIEAVAGPRFEGVFAAWYGKGPGVDRSGDAFKHGNYAGTHRHGGVLIFYGDDHAGKSSTVCHHSEQAVAASCIPSLYPSNVEELLAYGMLGYGLSRYSGLWVGIKCVNEVAEQTATVDLACLDDEPILPPRRDAANVHIEQGRYNPLREEQGSMSLTGIGCHTMVHFTRPQTALLPTQMGGEGGNWIGLAPFTETKHIFQNLGDGTYYHSGLLAIRGAVAAKVNITYKILYNDAVAITGEQPVDGPLSVAQIAHQVRAEGVKHIVLLSDDPARHSAERRMERALIADYEALAASVLSNLSTKNHGKAVELMNLADNIRGFGPVKEAAVKSYRREIRAVEEAFMQACDERVAGVRDKELAR